MGKERLEAFSDGVIAIIITIMVLELHVPAGADIASLTPLIPVFLSYVLSFVFVGIYWNNHHHLLRAASSVNGAVLWANLLLLFWLSLVPFAAGWMGEKEFSTIPVALYGFVMWAAGLAYYLLSRALVAHHGADSVLSAAIGDDRKGKLSLVLLSVGVPLAFISQWIACACYVMVTLMWFIPDRRIERGVGKKED